MSNSKNILYLISLMLLMLTGCEADTSWAPLPGEGEEPVEVRLHATTLGASVEVSRASYMPTTLNGSTQIGMLGGTYQNLSLTYYNDTRALKRTDQGTIYYPLQTDTMHIYAYAPFKEEAYIYEEDSVLVKSDWETSQEFDDYIIDPIWAEAAVTKNNPTDTLTFKHTMSKLQIFLVDTTDVTYTEHRVILTFDCPQYGKMSLKTGNIRADEATEERYEYGDSYSGYFNLNPYDTNNPYYEHTIMPQSKLKHIFVSFKKANDDFIYQYNYPEKDSGQDATIMEFAPGKINRIVIDFGKIKAPQVNASLENFMFEDEDEIYI